ncbi:MAG: DUF1667 domain-containing protein [Treponema sp.]|jgi:CxxC motif-containing protein|nr:DUF1667 domain-containing protein [Treponema sp.]
MRSLTCIVCPIGCALIIEENAVGEAAVRGNRCERGAIYAQEEVRAPKRVVTATCALVGEASLRRLPVKTCVPCPRERIAELLADLYATRVTAPVTVGDVIIADWKGSGISVVAARTIPAARFDASPPV